ncbi:CBF-domain-containing protein [Sparassis latifolia]
MSSTHTSLPAAKKRKVSGSDDVTSPIRQLETQLTSALSTNSSLNQLADLLDIVWSTQDAALLGKAIYAMYRVFVTIITNGLLFGREDVGQDTKLVRSWLSEKLHAYVDFVAALMSDEDLTLRTSALEILLSLQKHLSTSLTRQSTARNPQPQFHVLHFRKIVHSLLLCPPSPRTPALSKKQGVEAQSPVTMLDPDVKKLYADKWLSVYDDIRWFFLREATTLLGHVSREQQTTAASNMLSMLETINTFPTTSFELNTWWVDELGVNPPTGNRSKLEFNQIVEESEKDADEEDDWRKYFDDPPADTDEIKCRSRTARLHTLTLHQSLHSLASHRAVFTRAWLTLLPLLSLNASEPSRTLVLRVLNMLHRRVLPHLTKAILVMDWVGSCVDYGGAVGLLALNALFVLMKEYNLDYPLFYNRLYGFLDRDVLHLKHRARFFRLTELFLSSTHLPAVLVASFVKRLARLSLDASPSAIVMIIPFIYNLLRKHPALMCMIHRVEDDMNADSFDARESNPTLTNALNSSLWELHAQKDHYHAVVSTLACIFEEAFTRPTYAMEDFLDHTYNTLYDAEAKRRIRKDPVVEDEIGRFTGQIEDLWT